MKWSSYNGFAKVRDVNIDVAIIFRLICNIIIKMATRYEDDDVAKFRYDEQFLVRLA